MNISKGMKEVFRDLVKAAAEEGRSYNRRIQATSGPERHRLRQEKASLGERTRMLLLTYVMILGIPYRKQEKDCRDAVWPSALARTALPAAATEKEVLAWLCAEDGS